MSTCSTANSVHSRSHGLLASPRPHCNQNQDAVDQRCAACLKRRLNHLERQWDEYKTIRRTAAARPCHRRSRSDTTPSSAVVTGAGPETPGCPFPVLRCSPRKLFSSLQQAASSSGGGGASAGAGAVVTVGDGIGNGKRSRGRRYEEDIQDASSVCSVDAVVAMAAASSCSCSCECTIPRCPCGYSCGCGGGYGYGYSSVSSCSGSTAATSLFSLGDGAPAAVAGGTRKREGGRWTACGAGRFAAIAVVGVAVLGAMAVAVIEFGMDDGRMEFLVPT